MKNIFLTAALVLALGVNANVTNTTATKAVTEKQEKEYKKIETAKIPAAVKQEIDTKYEGYAITEAAASADGEYKISLTKAAKKVIVYYNSAGEYVKETK